MLHINQIERLISSQILYPYTSQSISVTHFPFHTPGTPFAIQGKLENRGRRRKIKIKIENKVNPYTRQTPSPIVYTPGI